MATSSSTSTTTTTSTSEGTSTSGVDSSTGPTAPEPCMCIELGPLENPSCEDTRPFTCELPDVCGHVGYTCPRPNPDMYACDVEYQYDEAELDCALTALRDRTPGRFTAGGENDVCGFEGCGTDTFLVAIADTTSAVLHSCSGGPLGPESWTTELATLASPEYFQGCLDRVVPGERYDCLFDGLQQRVAVCG